MFWVKCSPVLTLANMLLFSVQSSALSVSIRSKRHSLASAFWRGSTSSSCDKDDGRPPPVLQPADRTGFSCTLSRCFYCSCQSWRSVKVWRDWRTTIRPWRLLSILLHSGTFWWWHAGGLLFCSHCHLSSNVPVQIYSVNIYINIYMRLNHMLPWRHRASWTLRQTPFLIRGQRTNF